MCASRSAQHWLVHLRRKRTPRPITTHSSARFMSDATQALLDFYERENLRCIFAPPSAPQSWQQRRKVRAPRTGVRAIRRLSGVRPYLDRVLRFRGSFHATKPHSLWAKFHARDIHAKSNHRQKRRLGRLRTRDRPCVVCREGANPRESESRACAGRTAARVPAACRAAVLPACAGARPETTQPVA
jgi:hypothetical protein